jgi:hypothetical protein
VNLLHEFYLSESAGCPVGVGAVISDWLMGPTSQPSSNQTVENCLISGLLMAR